MQQQAQQQMFDSIGGAIDNLFGAYMQREEKVAKGKAMKNVFGVIAPSLGMDENTLKQLTGELKNPMDWYNFGEQVAPMIPSMINATLAQGRMGIQQNAPYVDQMLDNQKDVAGGKATWTPGGGGGGGNTPAPVEPPLPGEEPLNPPPAVTAPGPVANPITDASRQRAMTWWQKRSQGGP